MSKPTEEDPTGQATRRKRSARDIINRLAVVERQIITLFRGIPRKRRQKKDISNNRTFYEYELTATQLAELNELITAGIDAALQTEGDTVPFGWFWSEYVEGAYREGTLREVATLNRDITAAIAIGLIAPTTPTLDPAAVLSAPPYLDDLAEHINAGYQSIKGLSDTTSRQVFAVISSGIQAGLTPTEIVNEIRGRFDVSDSSARRIALTEINKAYNDAKMRLGRDTAATLGVRTGVLHISALLPTTRDTHAARHGNTYTVEAQLQWWNSGANRINCYCSIETVVVDNNGQPVNQRLQEELHAQRSFWRENDGS